MMESNDRIFKDWLMRIPVLWDSVLNLHTFANVNMVNFSLLYNLRGLGEFRCSEN